MANIIPPSNVFEFAQYLQKDLLDLPFDHRITMAVGALGMLGIREEIGKPFFIQSGRSFLKPAGRL